MFFSECRTQTVPTGSSTKDLKIDFKEQRNYDQTFLKPQLGARKQTMFALDSGTNRLNVGYFQFYKLHPNGKLQRESGCAIRAGDNEKHSPTVKLASSQQTSTGSVYVNMMSCEDRFNNQHLMLGPGPDTNQRREHLDSEFKPQSKRAVILYKCDNRRLHYHF